MKPLKSRIQLKEIIELSLPVVEVGVAEGLFSRDILAWGVPKVYLVDNWGTIPTQRGDGASDQEWHDKNYQNVLKINDPRAEILRGISWDMAARVPNGSIGMLYLDAGHSYECVSNDLEAWYPKVKSGSVVAGHDFANPDYEVGMAVFAFCSRHGIPDSDIIVIPENGIDASFYFVKP